MNEIVFFINKGLVSGLIIGSIYALGAIGVTLVFGILRFAHFAHGDMMTLGAFITLILTAALAALGITLPLPLAFIAMFPAMVITAFIAIGLDRTFYKPLRQAGARPVVLVMASVGVTLMLQGLIRLFAGVRARDMFVEAPKEIFRLPFPGASRPVIITEPQVLLIGFVIVAVIALHWFLTRSRLGKAMRAVSDNPELARITGINTDHVVWATWVIGGALACAAGTMLSMDVTLKPDLSFNILLPIFAATIVGGIGQPYGAIAGGFLVGFCETLAVFNWSILLRPIKDQLWFEVPTSMALVPTEYKLMVPFLILIIVLIFRPTGIFRGRVLA
ncbi:branched-chain amino acid ABC transporter permease [Hoeflea sp.]|uniref:branched-chain amino acid ABC transporter permease n=1 Tax=Hoeflea sp. TaxID=1940281 RepID=UPI003B0269A9